MSASRYADIVAAVNGVMKSLSGRDLGPADAAVTFFDLGFDSFCSPRPVSFCVRSSA